MKVFDDDEPMYTLHQPESIADYLKEGKRYGFQTEKRYIRGEFVKFVETFALIKDITFCGMSLINLNKVVSIHIMEND
jgi:hypothetical protein